MFESFRPFQRRFLKSLMSALKVRLKKKVFMTGFDSPRVSVSGAPLPSVRLVSITVSPDVDRPHPNISLLLMQFGQFVDHDITFTPVERMMNGSGIMCCQNGTFLPRSLTHPACYPIAIPPKDPFFSRLGHTCMPFVRSLPAPRSGCNFGIRNQVRRCRMKHGNLYVQLAYYHA